MSEDFNFERLIAARPEEVFDAITSPEGQRELYDKDRARLGRRVQLRATHRGRLDDRLRRLADRALPP